jgi:predicted ATPase
MLVTVKGMSASVVGEAYARAHELAQQCGSENQLFQALYGRWQHNSGSGQILNARLLSRELLHVTEQAADSGLRLQAHHSAWTTSLLGGVPVDGYQHAEAGIRIYYPEEHRSHRHIYGGHDPGVCARMTAAQLQWILGYPDRALGNMTESLTLADRLSHPFSRGTTLTYSAMLHLHRGEPDLALSQLARGETLAAEQRLSFVMEPLFLRGAAFVAQDAADEAIAAIRDGLAPGRSVATIWQPFALCFLAEALGRRGDFQEAHGAIRQALDRMNMTGERMWNAELHRIHGLVLMSENKREESEASFEQALLIAREQQAKSLELRAATSLARLWCEQGRRSEARELLAPVYGWFTEGFDTADLKEAKRLLDELM